MPRTAALASSPDTGSRSCRRSASTRPRCTRCSRASRAGSRRPRAHRPARPSTRGAPPPRPHRRSPRAPGRATPPAPTRAAPASPATACDARPADEPRQQSAGCGFSIQGCRSLRHEPKELVMSDDTFPLTLAAAQHGDEAAFTELFRATQPSLLRYLRVVAQADADDLAADTWVQVVRGLRSFTGDEPAAFRAWVLSIGRHRWLDHLRSRRRRRETAMALVPEQPGPVDPIEFVYDLMSTETALDLIRTLPREQAEVLMLRYVADLDVTRTAELLGKKPGAVRVLAHRGLHRLRAALNEVPDQRRQASSETASDAQPGVAEDQV